MATNYRDVLEELKAEEKRLVAELEAIRAMIPGAEVMASRMPPVQALSFQPPPTPARITFSGVGPKQAILNLLAQSEKPLMPAEITRQLLEGGIQTRSTDFSGMVGSTLTQMKGDNLVERKDEGWVLTPRPDFSSAQMQP
jgi:hypothetical protein